MKRRVLVIGGDLRQLTLASLLEKENFYVEIFGFDNKIDTGLLKKAADISLLSDADIIILPLPFSPDGVVLNSPFSNREIYIDDLLDRINKNAVIFGGKLSDAFKDACLKKGIRVYDYLKREELNIDNAIPTAEGAIEIALEETPYTLHKSTCLVIGYGRIGKILADRLKAFGADVTVSARKPSDFSWIEANNFSVADSNNLSDLIPNFNIIFNTVPSVILNSTLLKKIPLDTLVIDLASKPGGVDFELAKEIGLKVIWALSLPGKVAPITSGKIIKRTILNILKELEE